MTNGELDAGVYPAQVPVFGCKSPAHNQARYLWGLDQAQRFGLTYQDAAIVAGGWLVAFCGEARAWQVAESLYGPEVRPTFDALVAMWDQYRP